MMLIVPVNYIKPIPKIGKKIKNLVILFIGQETMNVRGFPLIHFSVGFLIF